MGKEPDTEAEAARISAYIEKVYNQLVISGRLRFSKRECPRSHLEDELTTYMAWEMYGMFGSTASTNEMYRNMINGNYILKLSTQRKGRSAGEMKAMLSGRLSKVRFGDGDYYGIQALPLDVKVDKDTANIELELVMPDLMRYTSIANYLERECDQIDRNMLYSRLGRLS